MPRSTGAHANADTCELCPQQTACTVGCGHTYIQTYTETEQIALHMVHISLIIDTHFTLNALLT